MPITCFPDRGNEVVHTHGLAITCPECGSLDEVNYNKGMDLYMCAFDGTVFTPDGRKDVEIGSYRLGDENGWEMNLIDVLFP